jgi:hypothetical protein
MQQGAEGQFDEDGNYICPVDQLLAKYFKLLAKYFGQCTQDEVKEFLASRQGAGDGVSNTESIDQFGQRVKRTHKQLMEHSAVTVRPTLAEQEVQVFVLEAA